MPFAPINGTNLYYEDHGKGTPFLLIHGMYGNHATWYQQVASLSEKHRVIALDLRGFGLSEDANALGSGGSTGDIAGLLDHLSIDNAILVGQSMGGAACLTFALNSPNRMRALVLAGSLGGIELPDHLTKRQIELTKEAAGLTLSQRMLSADFLRNEPARAELFRQLISFNRGASQYFKAATRPPAPTLERLQELADLIPVLLIVGDQDIVQPPEVVAEVSDLLPGAEISVIEASGHSAYFEQPEAFNASLLHDIESVLSREQPSVGSAVL
jgi:3-oxoadipate enol-lactonase